MKKLRDWLHHAPRKDKMIIASAVVLGIIGATAIFFGLMNQQSIPMPEPTTARAIEKKAPPKEKAVVPMTFAEPTVLSVPAIGIESPVVSVGQKQDGSMDIPKGDDYNKPAWYIFSPAPGQAGASIIEGHADHYEKGPSVFFHLGQLKPNDVIAVSRADGTRAHFEVTHVRQYQTHEFPTKEVHGPTDSPALRLITCGGSFNDEAGQYESNIVVFANLKSPPVLQSDGPPVSEAVKPEVVDF